MQHFMIVMASLAFATICRADGEATVPKVVGERTAVAGQLARLADLNCRVGVYFVAPQNWRNDIKPGVIYLQSPQPGTPVSRGSVIAAWTFARAADDATTLEVPDLRHQPLEAAMQSATDLGLKLLEDPPKVKVEVPIVNDDAPLLNDDAPRPDDAPVAVEDKAARANPMKRRVIDQYPAAGTRVYRGTSLLLTSEPISDAPPAKQPASE